MARGEKHAQGGFNRNGYKTCTNGQGAAQEAWERSLHTNAAIDNNAKSSR
jgi:hypothetical protein